MSECARCTDGVIETPHESLACPNCEDVCQWCNHPYDDGEPLGDTGLFVCRACIRDMADYKERAAWQLFITPAINGYVDDVEAFNSDLDTALVDAAAKHGVDLRTQGDWEYRNDDE